MTDLGAWQPLSVNQVARLMHRFSRPRWIAGGWAIDQFVGRQTREQADVEISVLRADQVRLREQLAGWEVHVAHGGCLSPWAGRPLVHPLHQFWARPAGAASWALEILLEDHSTCRCRWSDWAGSALMGCRTSALKSRCS